MHGSVSGIDSRDICMYICTYVGVMLGMLVYAAGFWHVDFQYVGFWHAGFQLCEVLFATRMVLDFQPWRSCNGFRARRARAATTRGAKQWALDIFTLQLHTLQMMKSWAGPRNEARVRASGAVKSCSASLMVSVVDITVPHSQTHTTCKHMSGHTYTGSAQGMIWIYIPSNIKSVQFPLISLSSMI